MLKVTDYSNQRGGVVKLLPKIHRMFKENALTDRSGTLQDPGHLVTWQQKMSKLLVDVNWRFIAAVDGDELAGVLFLRFFSSDEVTEAYIEEMQFSRRFYGDTAVFDAVFAKLAMDRKTGDAVFFVSERVRLEKNKEILASVGLVEVATGGFERLGSLSEARASLRIRFFAGSN